MVRGGGRFLKRLLSTLDEGQKRWFAGREALLLGRGGICKVCQASGLSKPTILRGIKELQAGGSLRTGCRVRRAGGGRKKVEEKDPGVIQALEQIMEESTAGDPGSLLKWTNKSTYQIRDQLVALGHVVSEDTVQRAIRCRVTGRTRKGHRRRNETSSFGISTG